ncbi:CinA family nicotinamide mononucleotide deamidase-related protein [Leuconostoc inhae]|uniref:CinA family nicotinamide mononucleotide deamidase-related protein n=2 Tax=Leuconostoc TaxID=1243 RepID=UPI001C7D0EB6|nr:CinA family nicotinamide mononucleotide deamidase-related protein [Leuconostoc inhae]
MKAEIISVGTELLLGEIIDTNRPYVARALREMGIESYHQSIVGDNASRLLEALDVANKRSDLIILIGGLGPTEDDLTKQISAQFLKTELVSDQSALSKLKNWHENANIDMAENNKAQALYLKGGIAVVNDVGFAIGSYYSNPNGADFLLLPGPPWEMEPMFDNHVRPILSSHYLSGQILNAVVMRYFGIGESRLSTIISDLIDNQENPTIATYAKKHEVIVRLMAKSNSEHEAIQLNNQTAKIINQRVGDYFYGNGEHNSLEQTVAMLLKKLTKTIGITEVFTQGMVQTKLRQLDDSDDLIKGGFTGISALLDLTDEEIETSGNNGEAIVTRLAELTKSRLVADFGLAIIAENPTKSNDNQYVTEKVWFALTQGQNKALVTSQVFAKDHMDNVEDAVCVALDLIRRGLLNKKIISRA